MQTTYRFTLPFEVRDYECDLQGIVNNAVYQHYLEHARHRYLRALGLDFAKLAQSGLYLVVTRAELDYKASLRSGQSFSVGLNVAVLSTVRLAFLQDVFAESEGKHKIYLKARIICTAVNAQGKPCLPPVLQPLIDAGSPPIQDRDSE